MMRSATAAVTLILLMTAATAGTPVERGRYLVEAVLACGNCHSPRTPPEMTIVPGKELSGGRSVETRAFRVTPGNITQDRKTGIGEWTAEELKAFLRTGMRPNGVPVAPAMPVNLIKALTPPDLDAVVAYLLTVPAIENEVEGPDYKKEFQHDPYPDAEKPFRLEEIASDPIVRGRYLAALSHCLECHTSAVDGVTDYTNSSGRGGKRFTRGTVLATNITSHPTKGIGSWTDDEIRRAMTAGVARDGRILKYPMPWPYFAQLEPSDLDALIKWVRTLPPKE
jgi:mono/diheme cytochrome c family protein